MLVKTKRERSVKWPRQGRAEHHSTEHHSAGSQSQVPAQRERRHGGPSQDRALYTCECGYVFEALVTTSVGCPHCRRTQAW
jgi:hypothetical protein